MPVYHAVSAAMVEQRIGSRNYRLGLDDVVRRVKHNVVTVNIIGRR